MNVELIGHTVEAYVGEWSYPKDTVHTVEVVLQHGEYKAVVIYQLRGNCLGWDILRFAVGDLETGEPLNMTYPENKKHIELDGEGYVKCLKLFDSNGDQLEIEHDDDICQCVTSVRIINWEER
ncbi:DUF5406 family protein [Paenibacillus larvae]|uniref:Uncharacterized protein n=8 Tax=root TaxID=1 RepID=A0A345ASX1_9CAUD|nr:DUF5406 family protein [Paenibacillus larvae]YP_010082332.1 DUF5406 family protein [Paenibacillus phage Halcyone]YP_010082423.1 DUF5406 family protein [Paenibacillus phage Scottie]YP_010082501.1 DUF5406 family protein [Paenibacillus phage Unity]AXF40004.1 hypothetical protein ASH_77 [Paenibacillus phage Ash]AXF40291.1 hypothetical protein LEY_77 [Paenibacillus phage Ley]AXF41032.1 hypothetical protein HEATH_78 [Paenibacillus phage Heath]MEB9608303.1 DUF5406 family protein [Bacillus cereus